MAKNASKPRPGVVFRFDWIPTLEKMSAEAKARFLMACFHRGRDPTHEINLDGLDDRDAIRLETLWEQAAPVVDADCYTSKYALSDRVYCGECGTKYKRTTWSKNGKKRIVWRCVSRLDYGTKYCHSSPTVDEDKLQTAILAALNSAMSEKKNSDQSDCRSNGD